MAPNECTTVLLTPGVDFEILREYGDGHRNVPVNVGEALTDEDGEQRWDTGYIRTRHRQLRGQRLLRRVGPSENSGLYEITERGYAALMLEDEYDESYEFEERVSECAQAVEIKPPRIELIDTSESRGE